MPAFAHTFKVLVASVACATALRSDIDAKYECPGECGAKSVTLNDVEFKIGMGAKIEYELTNSECMSNCHSVKDTMWATKCSSTGEGNIKVAKADGYKLCCKPKHCSYDTYTWFTEAQEPSAAVSSPQAVATEATPSVDEATEVEAETQPEASPQHAQATEAEAEATEVEAEAEATEVLGGQAPPPVAPSGACASDADQKALHSVGKKGPKDVFPKMSADCGQSTYSLWHGFKKDDFIKCLQQRVAVSEKCAGCFADAGVYGVANCKMKCMVGWCKQGCLDCNGKNLHVVQACAGASVQLSDATPC